MKCVETRHKDRDNALQVQVERRRDLEVNQDEVSPVKVRRCEPIPVHGANGCVSSLGGIKGPGFLGVMRGMDCVLSAQRADVMESVPGMSGMECMSTNTDGVVVSVTERVTGGVSPPQATNFKKHYIYVNT